MNKKRSLLIVLLIVTMTLFFVGCEKKEPDLTGKWIESEEDASLELYSDGTGIIAETGSDGSYQQYSCTWIAEDGRIKITMDLGILGNISDSADYELTEDTLTLKWDDETEIYHKADTAESTETIDEASEVVEEDNAEEQVAYYECSDEIKAATPESGMVQIDDMVFTYGSKLSEAISIVDNSLSSFEIMNDYKEDKLVLSKDIDYVVFHKNNEAYFRLTVKNLSNDTVSLKDCTIVRIISYKAAEGNIFYAGFDNKDDSIKYDYVKTVMNENEIAQESSFYDKNNNKVISIIYTISSKISETGELWVCFIFESNSGELQELEISEISLPTMYG